jgi:hypothetical protein
MRTEGKIVWSAVFGLLMVWASLAQIAPHLFGVNTDRQTVLRWLTPWLWNPALLWLALPLAYGWLVWWLLKIDSRVETMTVALPHDRADAATSEDADAWQYQEMEGRVWRYKEICSLPIPERDRLKKEKPAVWAAYWEETLRRPQYVTSSGTRWTRTGLEELSETGKLSVYALDTDLLEWRLHGQSF